MVWVGDQVVASESADIKPGNAMSIKSIPLGTWVHNVELKVGRGGQLARSPHGGGEGKSSGGRHPVTPWGVPTKGYKTRTNKRTDKFIVRRRNKK